MDNFDAIQTLLGHLDSDTLLIELTNRLPKKAMKNIFDEIVEDFDLPLESEEIDDELLDW